MKRILTLLFFLPLFAAGQCDTVTSISATAIDHDGATISFTTPNAHLYYVILYNGLRQNVNDPGGPYPAMVTAPLTGLTPSTEYTYSAEGSDFWFTTTDAPCDTVTNVVATPTSGGVTIATTAATYGTSYILYYIRAGETDTLSLVDADGDFTISSGLRPASLHYYQIATVCSGTGDTTRNSVRAFTTTAAVNYTAMTGFGYQEKRAAFDSTLSMPTMAEPSLRNGKNDKAAIIYDTVIQAVAVFNPLTQDWEYLISSGDGCTEAVSYVNTIAELEAYSGSATSLVVTDSLRGGVFNYYISGLTVDDGVVFDATGKGAGYWKRLYTEQEGVNVRWWGAIGDSSTLNSGYIQSAINFAFLNDVGMVKMPSGDYAINTTIQMKRGVRLVGSWVANSVDNFVSEEPLEGGTNLYASGLTGDFIQFDFTQTNSECPWSAGIYNINIWGNSQTSGYGVHFIQPSSGNGPAENGKIFSAGAINNCNIFKCYDGGIYAEFRCDAIDIDRVNVSQTQSGHGITIASTDCHINFTYSWKNQGSGLYITGTTTRILNSDFWDNNYDSTVNNSGSGIIDEGQVNFYQKVQCDNNDLYGVRLLKGTTYPTLVGRQIVFEGCRFLSNGELTDSTYSDIKIDSVQNSSISARIINCEFDYAANETNKVLYAISLDTIPSVLEIVGCFFGTARSNSALLPVNDFVAMYADIVGSRSSNSQLNNSPVQLEDGETGLDVQRGFLFETNNTSTTVIGGISGGKIGQKITVMVNDDYTQFDFRNSPTLHGFGGQKYVANRYDIVTCVTADGTNFGCIVSPVDTGGYWQREANYLTTKGTLDTVDVNKLIVQNDIFSTKRVLMHDTTVTANYTATTNDYLIRVDATSGNITVTVPTPFFVTLEDIQYQSGFIIERIDSSANVVTIQRGSVFYTVNNGVSVPINSRATAFVFSGTSTNWDVTYTQFNTLSTDNTATLINKTIAAGSNTITGISATNMSYSAYSFIANSTNATAVPSDRTFKEFSEQTISTTITWSGTTAPSGSTNNTYRWTQIGKMVNLYINISYSVAGTANTQILIDLPSDLPAPEVPTGFSGANAKIVFGTGGITTATTANFSGATRSFLTRNSGDSGWQIGISNSSSANAQAAFATISYKIP